MGGEIQIFEILVILDKFFELPKCPFPAMKLVRDHILPFQNCFQRALEIVQILLNIFIDFIGRPEHQENNHKQNLDSRPSGRGSINFGDLVFLDKFFQLQKCDFSAMTSVQGHTLSFQTVPNMSQRLSICR